jgi:cysteinyl-tRNA synthetase
MREVRLHDTLSGELRPLRPRDPGRVGIYACGPTVYAPIHVGNARPYVVFSLFKRLLEHEGYEATLVINITDVNDKIYAAAREAGVPSGEVARDMTARYVSDTDRLALGRPDAEPKATATIEPIVDLIAALIERGHAYSAGGDVYFSVASHLEYGKLSNRPLEQMIQSEDDQEGRFRKQGPPGF